MSSGYIPPKDEPGPEETLDVLRQAIFDNPRHTEMPTEEIARQLVLGGYVQEEPSPALVAEGESRDIVLRQDVSYGAWL